MDKKIKDAIKELKEISSLLFHSRDLSLKDYGEVISGLGRAEQMLLAADEKYYPMKKEPEGTEGQDRKSYSDTQDRKSYMPDEEEQQSVRDQLNGEQLHA